MKLISLLFLFILTSCLLSQPNKLPENMVYKRDMAIEVNGHVGEGTLVVPEAKSYSFLVESREQLDIFSMTSCNREWVKEKAWNVTIRQRKFMGWSRKIVSPRKIEFTYVPQGLEKEGVCPVWLEGYNKATKRKSRAFIDFRRAHEDLPATIYCNGEEVTAKGVGICETKVGLVQGIKFNQEMIVAPDERCEFSKSRGDYFEIPLKKDECLYLFRTTSKPYKDFRLTTIGYDKIQIRE